MTPTPLDRAMDRVDAAANAPATGFDAGPPVAPPSETLAPALSYDGTTGELFRLWLKTTLLAILTLGFYRFWGRTRIRRYLWSRLSLLDDRFEYDGTGMELFVRFLLVIVVVLLPLGTIGLVLQFAGLPLIWVAVGRYATLLVVFFLSLVGHYTGQRYRLSRSLWRGIRGGLDGSAWRYGFRALGYAALGSLTLSLIKPWQNVGLWRYEARYTRLGSRYLAFEGRGRDLFKAWLWAVIGGFFAALGTIIGVLVIVSIATLAIVAATKYAGLSTPIVVNSLDVLALAGGVTAVYVIGLLAVSIVWLAITARFERNWLVYSVGRTRFGEIGFALEATTRDVRRLRIGNFLIWLLTLGLGWPFVAHRTLRFYARTLRLDTVGIERLSQSEEPSRPPASGLAELFDTTGFA
ncbi:MAG TPA: DUF898 family protein [Stellaceae bacterium]|nr:DUF898 family protein [Stellaceae bacterium]